MSAAVVDRLPMTRLTVGVEESFKCESERLIADHKVITSRPPATMTATAEAISA